MLHHYFLDPREVARGWIGAYLALPGLPAGGCRSLGTYIIHPGWELPLLGGWKDKYLVGGCKRLGEVEKIRRNMNRMYCLALVAVLP